MGITQLVVLSVRYAQLKEASRTNSTFGFCRHESQRRKNQKSCFLPTLEKKRTEYGKP
jgi:hypothetical protein